MRKMRYVTPMATLLIQNELPLAPAVREVLENLERRHHTPQKLAARARLVLELADGGTNPAVAERLGMHPMSVRKWRARWNQAQTRLEGLVEKPKELAAAITEVLSDDPRSGAPPTFTPEQVAALIAMACEPPMKDGFPVSEWSTTLLAEEAVRRGVVQAISPATVWRFLKSGRRQTSQGTTLADQAPERPRSVRQARRGA
jgi:transposase